MVAARTAFAPESAWAADLWEVGQTCRNCDDYDLAALSLEAARGLPGVDSRLLPECLELVDEWTGVLRRFTTRGRKHFRKNPAKFANSRTRFEVIALADGIQRHLGVAYHRAFAEGEFDARDARNLLLPGILTGFGGTCATLPVLYGAIGRRLGYPLGIAHTRDHLFCRWDGRGDSFCFEVTGIGCAIHDEAYYRNWPGPLSAREERHGGLIRRCTPREELSYLAIQRGHCLLDNLQFRQAIEAFCLACCLAPHVGGLRDVWGLASYTWAIWQDLPTDRRDSAELSAAIDRVADRLDGLHIDRFRRHAAENVRRLLRLRGELPPLAVPRSVPPSR